MTKKTKQLTAAERSQACGQAVKDALQQFRCNLVAVPEFRADGIGGWRLVVDRIECVAAVTPEGVSS